MIEIDSGNMAKLIVGQYILLNILYKNESLNLDEKDIYFIVIHYYKDYNPQRTINNLQLVNEQLFNGKGLQFKIYNIEQVEQICIENISNKDKFIKNLI